MSKYEKHRRGWGRREVENIVDSKFFFSVFLRDTPDFKLTKLINKYSSQLIDNYEIKSDSQLLHLWLSNESTTLEINGLWSLDPTVLILLRSTNHK